MNWRVVATGCWLVLSVVAGAASADPVVVVSAQSPLSTLSRDELTDIYLGRLVRLPNRERIVPIDQVERSPEHDAFYTAYLGRSAAQIKAHWSKLIFTGRGQPPRALGSGEAVAEAVAANPNAIGYVDQAFVDERLRVLPIE
ncbi:phosphate ABC transporter substrate-binding protein [Sinimarinibacterium sp. CAU 1509]|uniref:phosphate ABC transporter substrate-binding protein n=1 Tax=Sinimarinibacterium sp. CAU 1509 TaxID=2562283 RepID=UPI0010AD903D|nr:phosphate ABC transporter substrate-binding protein [Sinimarinibacterium sp. CAU 1509]TJY60942.1 phosphate ABC transporter substrate-binding protein [Sinimarinibacterium sp. CAU 1509]